MSELWHRLDAFDARISEKLRIRDENSLRFKIAAVLAHTGDSWLWCGILFVWWLFAHGNTERTLAWWGGTIAWTAFLVFFLKRLIGRMRPEGEWGQEYRKTDPYSFPSGHSVRAGLIVTLAWNTFSQPWLVALFVLWAVLMMLSRVATGVHYLLDVIGGFIIGLLFGALWQAAQPWFFTKLAVLFDKSQWLPALKKIL